MPCSSITRRGEEAEGGEEVVSVAQTQLSADRRGAEGEEDHPIQRLHRGHAGPRLRSAGGQAVDKTDAKGQGRHSQGAERVQVLRNGRPRGQSAFDEVWTVIRLEFWENK